MNGARTKINETQPANPGLAKCPRARIVERVRLTHNLAGSRPSRTTGPYPEAEHKTVPDLAVLSDHCYAQDPTGRVHIS